MPTLTDRILSILATSAVALSLLGGTAAQRVHPKPPKKLAFEAIESPLGKDFPALGEQSSWIQDTTYEGETPDKSKRGVYPVGNGYVFTYMGLGPRANTMMALTGPRYAAKVKRMPRGNFGELTLDLGDRPLNRQRIRRVSGANFVVTEDRDAAGLALRTLTFAMPNLPTLVRVIDIVNGTKAAIPGLTLRARAALPGARVREDRITIDRQDGLDFARAVVQIPGAKGDGQALVYQVPELQPGARHTTVLTIATGESPQVRAPQLDLASAKTAVRQSFAWWQEKLKGTASFRTDNRRVMDLFRDWKVLMLTMRDASSGIVAPMVTRRGAYIRESSGPILTFLRYNMWSEARAILDFYYKAIRMTGEIREHYPVNLDFGPLQDSPRPIDQIAVPSSDLAAWVILQNFWYYRATRDAKFVEERLPFLSHLLRKQRRGKDSLMHFSGHENYFATLYTLDTEKLPRRSLFISDSPKHGRRAYSLASSVLFLMSIQGYGEMLDGVDRVKNPAKWAVDDPMKIDKPSQKWLARSFQVMKEIEKRFYVSDGGFPVRKDLEDSLKFGDDWMGFFAPAVSPVTGEVHKEPFANINLLPLWIGFTFPTGERSRHNLRNTLGRLAHTTTTVNGKTQRKNTLVGATATVGHFTGDTPGMLLTALVERDGRDRVQAFEDLLAIAQPACEWGRFYAPSGRPIASPADPEWPDRLSPNECGINLDAAIFAINGVRHVNVPNFDNKSIKLKLRLPSGATFLNMDNLKKDGRAFNVHVDEFYAPLSDAERKQNEAQQDKRFKKNPNIDHRRFRFRMRLLSDNPKAGRYQVDADVSGTMFVRYLYRGVVDGQSGEIDDREFWKEDKEQFFLDGSETVRPKQKEVATAEGQKILVLTNRPRCKDVLGTDRVTYVDTGLPIPGRDLVRRMLKAGKPTHPTLYLDHGYDATDRRTFRRRAFWAHPNWKRALDSFTSAGGRIMRPRYEEQFRVRIDGKWQDRRAPGGRLALDGKAPKLVELQVRAAKARDDVVLRFGSGCGYAIRCNGETVAEERGARPAVRDQDSMLISLKSGVNKITIEMSPEGEQVIFVQLTGPDGMPIQR